jgi:hypothetical protein
VAVMVLKNPEVWIANSTALVANRIKSCTLNYEAAELETTAFSSSTGPIPQRYVAGMTNWSADVELYQDYAASSVDALMFPLIGADDVVMRIAISTTGVDATNPQYTGNCLLTRYTPFGGSVGEVAMTSITLRGTGVLTRNTASCSGY